MELLRVLIVEDSATFVRGLTATLQASGEFTVVGAAANGAEAISLATTIQPQIALVDLRIAPTDTGTPDYQHGLATITTLRTAVPGLQILAMSFDDNVHWPDAAVRAGASGFISKNAPPDAILDALRMAAQGKVVLTTDQLAAIVTASPPSCASLTPRELAVLQLAGEGKSNREIGAALGISTGTARTHMQHILAKLDVANRLEAVTVARQQGCL